ECGVSGRATSQIRFSSIRIVERTLDASEIKDRTTRSNGSAWAWSDSRDTGASARPEAPNAARVRMQKASAAEFIDCLFRRYKQQFEGQPHFKAVDLVFSTH